MNLWLKWWQRLSQSLSRATCGGTSPHASDWPDCFTTPCLDLDVPNFQVALTAFAVWWRINIYIIHTYKYIYILYDSNKRTQMLYIVSFSAIAIFPLSLSVSVSLLRTLSNDVWQQKNCVTNFKTTKKETVLWRDFVLTCLCACVSRELNERDKYKMFNLLNHCVFCEISSAMLHGDPLTEDACITIVTGCQRKTNRGDAK